MFLFFIGIALVVVIDVLTKEIAIDALSNGFPVDILPFVSLHLEYNPWIAFSVPVTGMILKVLTALLIIGIFAYYMRYEHLREEILVKIGYIGILGGALGNAIERIGYGRVTDFIRVEHFSTFNIADACLTCGVVILFFSWYQYGSLGSGDNASWGRTRSS